MLIELFLSKHYREREGPPGESAREKLSILRKLMEKYQPEGGYDEFAGAVVRKTAVIEISIEELTGKQSLGS
jgi:hypothetical protein